MRERGWLVQAHDGWKSTPEGNFMDVKMMLARVAEAETRERAVWFAYHYLSLARWARDRRGEYWLWMWHVHMEYVRRYRLRAMELPAS